MKILTITDAKKNLGRWLRAAARGEDVGVVCGADIIALRKVAVEPADYARGEYGVTEEQIAGFAQAAETRYQKLKRAGSLTISSPPELRKLLEKTARD